MSAFEDQVGGSHYKNMAIQPAKFIRANNVPHLEAEIIYRALRHKDKAGKEDIEKIIHTAKLILELDYS